jgi:S-DNA-T family DNA segregation ATPase FtsK/SpoIIIE
VSAADEHDAGRTVDRLLSILRAAAAVGLTIVIAGDRGTLAPRLTALVTQRLVLRLADRADLALAGLPALAVGDAPPPGRAVRVHDHAEIQLATPPVRLEPAGEPAHPQAPNDDAEHPLIRLRPLPRQVALANLPRHPGRLWLGVAGDAAEPLGLDLAARTGPLLVAGPPRSGRSTVLHTLFAQANAAGLAVVVVAPTRSPVFAAARASGRAALEPRAAVPRWPTEPPPALVLVDDCEQCLDTPLGDALTAWVERHAAGTTVVVAGRSDELAVAFRGLGAIARRGAHGVLLRPGPGDGDVFGLRLPRTRSLDPPGRGLLVEDSDEPIPIQIAEP